MPDFTIARRGLALVALASGALLAATAAAATTDPASDPASAFEGEPAPAGDCVAFGDPCGAGDRCCTADGAFGLCHAFGRGSRCTIACPSDPADCPNAGRGCNNQSPPVCKSPRHK